MEPMKVAENGSFTIVGDPGGAGIGAWQADQVSGFEIWNKPGAPRWFELNTRDYDASVDFYRDVFKWNTHTFSDQPEFRYTTLRTGADNLAGIQDATESPRRGARVLDDLLRRRRHRCRSRADRGARWQGDQPAEDTPYGRLAQAADPTGTSFKLMASSS